MGALQSHYKLQTAKILHITLHMWHIFGKGRYRLGLLLCNLNKINGYFLLVHYLTKKKIFRRKNCNFWCNLMVCIEFFLQKPFFSKFCVIFENVSHYTSFTTCVSILLKKAIWKYQTDTIGLWIMQENTVKTVLFNKNRMKIWFNIL